MRRQVLQKLSGGFGLIRGFSGIPDQFPRSTFHRTCPACRAIYWKTRMPL